MPRLTKLRVRGFRSLKDVELDLGRTSVLIGPNGAGKSNLLSVLKLLPLIRTQSLRRFVAEQGGASKLLYYGQQITRELEIEACFEDDDAEKRWTYATRLGYAAGDTFIFLDEQARYLGPETPEEVVFSLGAGHAESKLEDEARASNDYTVSNTRKCLAGMSFYHFHDTSLTAPLRENGRQADAYYLRSDGSNLASYLYKLATSEADEDKKAWLRIELTVRRFAPFIKRLQPELVDPNKPDSSAVRLRWVDKRDYVFDTHDLSDGTLRGLALVVALCQPSRTLPSFISIDEPELGLHPAALNILVGLIRSVRSRCQVLLATQSPALLDQFAAEEVVVCERADDATTFRRLDVDELESWLEDYKLSELYDKNLLGGRP